MPLVCKYRVSWPTASRGMPQPYLWEIYRFITSPPPAYGRKENKFLSWIQPRLVRHSELYLSGLIWVCWKQPPRPCLRRKIASFIYHRLALFLQSIPYWDAISQETLPVHAGLSFPIAGARNEAHIKGKSGIKSRELHVACWKKGKSPWSSKTASPLERLRAGKTHMGQCERFHESTNPFWLKGEGTEPSWGTSSLAGYGRGGGGEWLCRTLRPLIHIPIRIKQRH